MFVAKTAAITNDPVSTIMEAPERIGNNTRSLFSFKSLKQHMEIDHPLERRVIRLIYSWVLVDYNKSTG